MNRQTCQWLDKQFWTAHRPNFGSISSSCMRLNAHTLPFFISGNQCTSLMRHETVIETSFFGVHATLACQYVVLLCWFFLFVIYFCDCTAFTECCIWSVSDSQSWTLIKYCIYMTANAKISLPQSAAIFIYVYYIERKSVCFSLCYCWCRVYKQGELYSVVRPLVLFLWQWHYRMNCFVLNHGHVCLIWGTGWLHVVCLMMLYQVCLLQLTGTRCIIQTGSVISCRTWYGIILTNVYIYLLPCGGCVCARVWVCTCVCQSVCIFQM